MTTRNTGYVNPFAQQGQARSFGRAPAASAPYGQQQQGGFGYQPEQEEDDRFQAQAYMKIKFHTADGVKTLKWNGKDKPLREASELEQMILDHWRAGGDVNELLECMELEVVDATPKERGTNSFVSRRAEAAPPAPKPAKPRTRRAAAQADEGDEE